MGRARLSCKYFFFLSIFSYDSNFLPQLIDMPPGTGDIQITLSQSAQFSGAMVVSTPHPLALIDAAKGNLFLYYKMN